MTRPPLRLPSFAVALVALLFQPLRAQASQGLSLDAGLDRPALEQVMRRSAIAFPLDGSLEFGFRRRLGDRTTAPKTSGDEGAEAPVRRMYVPSTFRTPTSTVAFEPRPRGAAVIVASLSLLRAQVAPALRASLREGLTIGSLSGDRTGADRSRLWLHGQGEAIALARRVRAVLDEAAAFDEAEAPADLTLELPAPDAGGSQVSEAPLEAIFDAKAEVRRGQVEFTFDTPGPLGAHGLVGGHLGQGTVLDFFGTDAEAVLDAGIVVPADRLPALLGAVLDGPLAVASITSRFGGASDRLVVQCVGGGAAAELARAAKAALAAAGIRASARAATTHDAGHAQADAPDLLGLAGGELGPDWRTDSTPADAPDVEWQVGSAEGGTPLLGMKLPEGGDLRWFNLCLNTKQRFQDLRCAVRMRAEAGRVDQGGGPAWRVQDGQNYYVARYNPLERDLRLYYVKDGRRVQLAGAGGLDVRTGAWYTLAIEHVGDRITCRLDGRVMLRVRDDTFAEAGGIGLWTKADARSTFAWLHARSLPRAAPDDHTPLR